MEQIVTRSAASLSLRLVLNALKEMGGHSQETFAKMIGKSQSQVSRDFTTKSMSCDEIYQLASVLEYPFFNIFKAAEAVSTSLHGATKAKGTTFVDLKPQQLIELGKDVSNALSVYSIEVPPNKLFSFFQKEQAKVAQFLG